MSGRNYWHVYNWLRRHYIATGVAAERMDLLEEFAELEPGRSTKALQSLSLRSVSGNGGGTR